MVHDFSSGKGEVSILDNQVGNTLVEMSGLRNISDLEQLLEIVDSSTNSIIVISQRMRFDLKVFNSFADSTENLRFKQKLTQH